MAYSSNDLPFALDLKSIHGQGSVKCEQLLRDLPGKRKVFRGSWQKRAVVVKLFFDPKTAHRHWRREKVGVEALQGASVLTPELLFAGDLEDGTPALIFDFLPDAQTALQVWDRLATMDQKSNFLRQLVEIVADLHNAGLVQEDLHLENFLVSDETIYSIDGDAVRNMGSGKPLTDAGGSRNLALLFAQLPPKFDCLVEGATRHYAELRGQIAAELLAKLSTELPDVRCRRRQRYVEKCYRSCSEFKRSDLSGKITIVRRDQAGLGLSQLLEDPDAFMARGELLKDGRSSTVVRVQGDNYDWVVKRYNIKDFWYWLRRCFRNTRAWISWGNAHRLKISGIATPQAIAMIEKRFGPLRSTGYYVTEFISGRRADKFFLDDTVPDAERQQTAKSFVELFGLMRKLGIHHGDFKAANFLIRDFAPWVLDLDAMSECRPGVRFEKLSQVDRERFLRNWQEQPGLQKWFDEHLPKTGLK